jgi:hypothetical protein
MPQNLILDEPLAEADPRILLGRFITDYHNPLDNYFPDRSTSLDFIHTKYLLPVQAETDFTRFVSSMSSDSIKARIHNIAGASASSQTAAGIRYESLIVKSYKLEQIQDAFAAVMKDPAISTRLRHTLASQSDKQVYWIIGLKTITDAKYKSGLVHENAAGGELTVPIGTIVTGAFGVPVGETGNVEVGVSIEGHGETSGSGKLKGERVFAVRYCPVKPVRRAGANILNWKKTEPKMGPPKNFTDTEGFSFSTPPLSNLGADESQFEEGEEDVVLDADSGDDTQLVW